MPADLIPDDNESGNSSRITRRGHASLQITSTKTMKTMDTKEMTRTARRPGRERGSSYYLDTFDQEWKVKSVRYVSAHQQSLVKCLSETIE